MYGLSDKRSIKKYLLILKDKKYIQCKKLNKKTKPSDLLKINLIKFNDELKFSCISNDLLFENINKIGHVGFSLYCLLFKNHNINYNLDGGYACCTEEYMANILNICINTVKKYLYKLTHLINIQPQPPYIKYENNELKTQYAPNQYIVIPKIDFRHKYHVKLTKKDEVI